MWSIAGPYLYLQNAYDLGHRHLFVDQLLEMVASVQTVLRLIGALCSPVDIHHSM